MSATEADHDTGRNPAPAQSEHQTAAETVIEGLDRRLYGRRTRERLRDSLDRADAPATGRAGADEGLGRAISR